MKKRLLSPASAMLSMLWAALVYPSLAESVQSNPAESIQSNPAESIQSNPAELIQSNPAEGSTLHQDVQYLKQQVLDLNRDLFILEEELLFPANTQLAVFLSMDIGKFFQLDSVELKIDDQTVTHYLYTQRQVDALHRGGVQRLYVGNVKTGQHEISAFFIGKGPQGRDMKRAASLIFKKSTDVKMLELKVVDSTQKYQADFTIVEWE